MSYDIIETSVYSGEPIELYTFTRGALVWRYTSTDQDISIGGNTYTSVIIDRDKLTQSQDPGKNSINLQCTYDLPFLEQYFDSPPSDTIILTIQRYHLTDVAEEIVTIWKGRVINVNFRTDEAEISCEPLFTAMKRPALRRFYQKLCPHTLYGPWCGLAKATYLTTATLTGLSADGLVLTSSSFTGAGKPDGFFTGGTVEFLNGTVLDKRFILNHVGTNITINIAINDLVNGDSVDAYPGCDHTLPTCVIKFTNEENYGGQPYRPNDKNPMGGTPVF